MEKNSHEVYAYLGLYVSKIDGKQNSGGKGIKT